MPSLSASSPITPAAPAASANGNHPNTRDTSSSDYSGSGAAGIKRQQSSASSSSSSSSTSSSLNNLLTFGSSPRSLFGKIRTRSGGNNNNNRATTSRIPPNQEDAGRLQRQQETDASSIQTSETTPLLWASASVAPSIADTVRDEEGRAEEGDSLEDAIQEKPLGSKLNSCRQWCFGLIFALVVLVTTIASGLFYFYHTYMPLRLQRGSGESGTAVASIHIATISADSIQFTLSGFQKVGDPSPVDVFVQPSEFTLVSLGEITPPHKGSIPKHTPRTWEDEDDLLSSQNSAFLTLPVAKLAFPGLHIEPNTVWSNLTFSNTSFHLLNTTWSATILDQFVRGYVNHTPVANAPDFISLRHQSKPIIAIPALHSSWEIPIWGYHHLPLVSPPQPTTPEEPPTQPSPNASQFNVTVATQNVWLEPRTLPDGLPTVVYVFNATVSFTNPLDGVSPLDAQIPADPKVPNTTVPAVSLANPELGVQVSLFHEGVRMAKVVVEMTKGRDGVVPGWNEEVVFVKGASEAGKGTDKFVEWIGKYAEGEDTWIEVSEIGFVYPKGKKKSRKGGKLVWVEKVVREWRFPIQVPGAQEEEFKQNSHLRQQRVSAGSLYVVLEGIAEKVWRMHYQLF